MSVAFCFSQTNRKKKKKIWNKLKHLFKCSCLHDVGWHLSMVTMDFLASSHKQLQPWTGNQRWLEQADRNRGRGFGAFSMDQSPAREMQIPGAQTMGQMGPDHSCRRASRSRVPWLPSPPRLGRAAAVPNWLVTRIRPRFGSKSRIQFACVRCLSDMHVSEICRIKRTLNYGFCRKHNIIAWLAIVILTLFIGNTSFLSFLTLLLFPLLGKEKGDR